MPRVFHVTDFRQGVRHMVAPAVALIPFGLVCGVAANAAGASVWAAFGLSAVVFSGAAQILATELHAAGAPAYWGNPRVPATLVAGTVAFAMRSTGWTVVAGMAALWALQFLMS